MEAYHLALFGAAFTPVSPTALGDKRKRYEAAAPAKQPTCRWLGGDLYLYSKDPADEPAPPQGPRKPQGNLSAIHENAPPLSLSQKRSMLKRTRQTSKRLLNSSTSAIASATASLKNIFSTSKPPPPVSDDVPLPQYKKLKRSSYAD
ncbi:hypothetical protein WJX74_005662 [Apatococcus lobatus]|uniref:Uncharacterized protein n=1 Tax=Apatococcus lobatus TaxID=904363 RepID=A0AAW1RCY5_9CHLO